MDELSDEDKLTVNRARRGNKFAASSYLKEALQKDPSLKQYAENDLELQLLK